MTDPIKAEPMAWMYEGPHGADLCLAQWADGKWYAPWNWRDWTETPLYTHAQLVEARRLAWNEAIEAAAAYVDGKGGTVIPGATVFAALVSGNFQPCMSGDARDRLHPHIRRRFDAATHTLTRDIRALTKDSTHD